MVNLLEETLKKLQENGKSEKDVLFVESFPLVTDWDSFKRNANFEYDNGYGCNEISLGLKIVGDTWWLERDEYDGSEWWNFKTHPDASTKRNAYPHEIMRMIKE
jgi:hypothetical protein